MQHNDFDKVTLAIVALSCFGANGINVLLVNLNILFIFWTILCVSTLRLYPALLRDLWKHCVSSDDPHNLRYRMTVTRRSKRIRKVRLPKTTSRGVQSHLRQLYFPALMNERQNVIPHSRVGVPHRWCEKLRRGTKWLYGPAKSYDKWKRY